CNKWSQFLNLLFDKGGDLEQCNKQEETALIYVLKMMTSTKILVEQRLRLHWLLTRLIEQGASNLRDKLGNTPLLALISKEHQLEAITLLLKYSQDEVNARNN